MGERMRYEPGTFCWVGLATSDPADAKVFYTSLFGWQGEDYSGGEAGTYTLLRRDGKDVAMLYRQTEEARSAGAPPHWTSYISVRDAAVTSERAAELGGAAVFRRPLDVLDAGRVATIRDPTGAVVSLWQSRSKLGAELVNDLGAWCWNELSTTDVERAKVFYGDLFGWEYESDESGYTTIKNAGSRNGGMRKQGDRERRVEPSWRPYFTVESADHASDKALQGGGQVVVPPTDVSRARLALIVDPQGAPFVVFQGETDP
jgi:predicted enzyme related to lactoylglutathione lyase